MADGSLDFSAMGSETTHFERFIAGWYDVASWEFWLAHTAEVALAAALAIVIALHPRDRGRAPNIQFVDQPKALTLYAIIAVVVAEIAQVYPAMAFVIFGIGGLMRFRTDMGLPKLTGRAILVVVVGLAIGLQLFALALLATAAGWIAIFALNAKTAIRLRVSKLPKGRIGEALTIWVEKLGEEGVTVVNAVPNEAAGELELLLLVPDDFEAVELRERFNQRVPEALRGLVEPKVV